MCDRIDGVLSFIVYLTLGILSYSIKYDDLSKIDEHYPHMKDYKDSIFLNKSLNSAESRVETCILVLSVLSYVLPKRNDLVDILEKTLKENA